MPNWTAARLIFLLPEDRLNEFRAAISGPDRYHVPLEVERRSQLSETLSGHERIQFIANKESLEEKFRQMACNRHYPDWMPISLEDLVAMEKGVLEPAQDVPFSISRLNPIKHRDEFDRFFPSQGEQAGFWTCQKDQKSRLGRETGTDLLYTEKVGARSILFDMSIMDTEKWGKYEKVSIYYNTKWRPVDTYGDFLSEVMKPFGAKALHVWEYNEEAAGYEYFNPHGDQYSSGNLPLDDFRVSEEDEDGEFREFVFLDMEDLIARAVASIDDPDFESQPSSDSADMANIQETDG